MTHFPAAAKDAGMTHHDFSLCDTQLTARADGALWLADHNTLVVSDLHLCKSERFARKGRALLPPFDTRDTLTRLDAVLDEVSPARVICLGDSFDDVEAIEHMPDAEKLWLARMQAGREWVWIAGNHDAGPVELGGEYVDEVTAGSLTFRHIAESGAQAEVSGHYHPKHSLSGPARACFVYDENRLIMPAFGTYTGGIPAVKSPIRDLFAARAFAVLTGPRALVVPLP